MEETKTTLVKELEQFEPDVFWEKNGKKIIAGTVVVLVLIVGVLMWQRQQQAAEEQAGYRLSQAMDVASLQSFVNTSQSKNLVPIALMRLGDRYFREGQYAESAAVYQQIVERYPQSPMVGGAKFSLGAIQEAQGQFEVARGIYSELAGSASGYAGYLARLGVARCTEALGQTKEARQLYEELLMAGQMAGGQSLAMIRWAVLGRNSATNETVIAPKSGEITSTEEALNQLLK